MTPRKKNRIQNPQTVTPPVEDNSNACPPGTQEGCSPDSCSIKNDEKSSC